MQNLESKAQRNKYNDRDEDHERFVEYFTNVTPAQFAADVDALADDDGDAG